MQVSCTQRRFRIQFSRALTADLDLREVASIKEQCVDVEASAVLHLDAPIVFAVMEHALGCRVPAFRRSDLVEFAGTAISISIETRASG